MAHFTTSAKRYREGTAFDGFGGDDLEPVPAGTSLARTAPPALPDSDGTVRPFLFWDTGRRLTSKSRVRWTFNHPENWATWNAVAWYGTAGNGPGEPTWSFDAFWVGNGTLDPTPIDAGASTFTNGPNPGDVAYPWMGNDRQVRTEWGDNTVRAKDHLQRLATDPLLNFSDLLQLRAGGDTVGEFDENDDGIPAGSSGPTGLAGVGSQQIVLGHNSGGTVMAAYVQPVGSHRHFFIDELIALVTGLGFLPPDKGDPSPDDIIRLKLIAESLDLVRGERPSEIDAFEGLVGAAAQMDASTLRRTIAGTQATLLRGEAALKSMQAMAAKLDG